MAFQKLLEQCNECISSRRRLLQRGLQFYVCTVNKSVDTKSGNISYAPRNCFSLDCILKMYLFFSLGFLYFLLIGVLSILDTFFRLSHFPLTAVDSQRTLNVALVLVGLYSAASSTCNNETYILFILGLFFRCSRKSTALVCYYYRILIANLIVDKWDQDIRWIFLVSYSSSHANKS